MPTDIQTNLPRSSSGLDVSKTNNKLFEDLEMVKDKIRETSEAVAKAAHDMRGKAGEMLHNSTHEVRVQAAHLEENVINYVKGNPLKSIGFAALAGALIGLILRK